MRYFKIVMMTSAMCFLSMVSFSQVQSKGSVYDQMLDTTRFDVGQSYSDLSTGETIINFNTPTSSNVEVAIYNMFGVAVISEVVSAEAGINEYRFDASKLSSGMYVYTMCNNGNTITKRMSVK